MNAVVRGRTATSWRCARLPAARHVVSKTIISTRPRAVGGTWYVQIADGELDRIGVDEARDKVLCECPLGTGASAASTPAARACSAR